METFIEVETFTCQSPKSFQDLFCYLQYCTATAVTAPWGRLVFRQSRALVTAGGLTLYACLVPAAARGLTDKV